MIRLKAQNGMNFIDEPAYNQLSYVLRRPKGHHFTGVAVFNALSHFIDWFIDYATIELAGKGITQLSAANKLFVREITNNRQKADYLTHSLYAALEYARDIKSSLNRINAANYYEVAMDILADYEILICEYETICNHRVPHVVSHWGKSNVLHMREMIWAAGQVMFAETISSMKDFNYHDVRPIVSFQVRQIIEILGRNIIGYNKITKHSNGREALNMTQVAWKFLAELEKNGNLPHYITMPMPPTTIRKMNEWSNSFVHRVFIDTCYIRNFALHCINTLMALPQNDVLCYDGHRRRSLSYGDIRISNYNAFKNEFDRYLNPRRHIYDIDWLPLDQVGAYIISL